MPTLHLLNDGPLKVSVIGSGNWGSVIGKIVATKAKNSYLFSDDVNIWVFDEIVNGQKLSHIINTSHENTKYLPGVMLPPNLKAVSSLEESVKNSDLLVFVLPHQFVKSVCERLAKPGVTKPTAKAISLVKGFYVGEGSMPKLHSSLIKEILGLDCCVLSGANVASGVSKEEYSESTIGYTDIETGRLWQLLFDTPYFKMCGVPDVQGVEICGAVKNVIALAAGFCDGLDLGSNTKAAIIRQGFEELRLFSVLFFNGILEETFFDSAGIADTITSCFGGRNVRCAAEFARQNGKASWKELEELHLNGQKLQGTLTCQEMYEVLSAQNLLDQFPLFHTTYKVAFQNLPAENIVNTFKTNSLRRFKLLSECNECLLPSDLKYLKLQSGL